MTRKSKREIERALEDVDESDDVVGYEAALRYLDEHVAQRGAAADPPEEHFGADAKWHPLLEQAPAPDPDALPLDLDAEQLTPVDVFGLRYCGRDVRRGVLAMRLAGADGGAR